jgi:hypothetical protein
VEEWEFEVQVGDVLEVDGVTITVLDIDGDEVNLRIDDPQTGFAVATDAAEPSDLPPPK